MTINPVKRALVVLSGGQDSTTCLYLAKRQVAQEIIAITFNYGQRHDLELTAARTIARAAQVRLHEQINVGSILEGTSPLVNPRADVETYASAEVLPGGIEKTFVPMRNALFLTIAANRAVVHGCDAIITGVSQEDYGGYPDCRKPFLDAVQQMIDTALGESVAKSPTILAPLLYASKKDTVLIAAEMPECMAALAYSHTCYNGAFPPCGQCHACLLRAKGFAEAGIEDPLIRRVASNAAA